MISNQDVEKLLFKTFDDSPEAYLHHVEQVMAHPCLIVLGENDKKQVCYTTKHQYRQEAKLHREVLCLMKRRHHVFKASSLPFSERYHLSDEQHQALTYLTQGPDISVLIGRPGTGKSYLLQPVKDYFESQGCHVIAGALSGKVAKSLQTETGIPASTLASLTYRLKHNLLTLTDKHILIIDEAGMVNCSHMASLIRETKKAGSKLILIGDPNQLKPIHQGEIFKGISAITGFMELEQIKRQLDLSDRQASLDFAKGKINLALTHYHDKGAIHLCETPKSALDTLITQWQVNLTSDALKDTVLLAFTRAAVHKLNLRARKVLQDKHFIGHENNTHQGIGQSLHLSTGERLLFRQNDKTLGVRNGDLGTLQSFQNGQANIKLDSGERVLLPKTYSKIDYGYALTVHKSQGMTVNHTHVLIDSPYWDKHLSFVAMTRHRKNLTVYADKLNHPTFKDLKHTLSRSTNKHNVIDWPIDFATRMGINPDKWLGKALNRLTESRRNHVMKALKKEYPVLAQYEALAQRGKHLAGYYWERVEKERLRLGKALLADKGLMVQVMLRLPNLGRAITRIGVERELGRGIR